MDSAMVSSPRSWPVILRGAAFVGEHGHVGGVVVFVAVAQRAGELFLGYAVQRVGPTPQATRALQPPKPSTTSTEGRRIVKRHTRTRGSPSCGRDPHTTLRVAARWPPIPAPEASGCALLVTSTSRRARTRPDAAAAETPPTRAPGRASRAGLLRRGHPAAPVVPQACWRSGWSGRARSAKSRPG